MDIDYDIGRSIKLIDTRLKRGAEKWLKSVGLSFMEMNVLVALYEAEGRRLELKMIESRLVSPQSTVFGTVRKLEERGLVSISVNDDDRRVRIASLTEKGLDVCLQSVEDRIATERMVSSGLTDEEAKILKLLLEKVVRTMKEAPEK